MNPSRVIALKRDGAALSREQISWLIRGFVSGEVADCQMSAFCMAVFFRGMSHEETFALTQEMLQSGLSMTHSAGAAVVDKHSTGGVGDKTSLVLAPLLAACGLRIPMISGRGLGPTGGTLDKLEAISGFRTDLTIQEIAGIVNDVGCVITGATGNLVPADQKLYALRDVTATVPSIPLITASIMSKKIAESLDALVLDVKFGTGSFMKTRDQAETLARSLVRVGELSGVRTTALITDMNQPLGQRCGHAAEVLEVLDVLSGTGPQDVRELTVALGVELLTAAEIETSASAAADCLHRKLDSGDARECFDRMVAAQGGDLGRVCQLAPERIVESSQSGFVASIDLEILGHVIVELGGGRKQAGHAVDHSVGLDVLKRVGDETAAGEPLVRIFGHTVGSDVCHEIQTAFEFSESHVSPLPLIVDRVSRDS